MTEPNDTTMPEAERDVAAELDELPEWQRPEWQGHTHSWPELANLDELDADHVVSCSDCGLPQTAGVLRDALHAAEDGEDDAGD